ncbi:tetratricopeptide repeat protein [Dolichospermum circinale]|uniref:tetratricopeptide repeat protein n=1 Tax=Dolichospermum circinale TaxID=109265 RepID=UPI00232AB9AE|nr:hypothetical protein [Dolichospermum circinale]MDB9451630.1 hypothetical protein [Dolichospermum circinale CS-547]
MSNTPQKPTSNIQTSPTSNTNPVDIDSNQKLSQSRAFIFLLKIKKILDKTEPSLSLIVNFVALLSVFTAGFFYIDTKVNKAVLDKFTPYENLQVGKALLDTFAYDEAIPDLEIAFKKLGNRFATDEITNGKYYLILDYYLYAIVNSTDPLSHKRRFQELLKIEKENKIAFRAWHYHQLAWYYFRTGSIEEAKINFNVAIKNYRVERKIGGTADSFWGLTLVDLCKGDLDSAEKNYKEAYIQNTSYAPESVLRTINIIPTEGWYETLIVLYDIEKHLPKFAERVRKVKPMGSVIRGSDTEGYGHGFGK